MACAVVFCTATAFGDEVDNGLPESATTELKACTRDLIGAGIDREDVMRMTRAMLESRFRAEHIVRAQKIVKSAYQEGLPAEPIMNKVHEGIAKGVPPELILGALEKVKTRYAFADEKARAVAQNESQRRRIMEEIAKCLAAGMSEHDIGRLEYQLKFRITERPKEEADGLAVETYRAAKVMLRHSITSMQAADITLEALINHYDARKMKTLRQEFMKQTEDTSAQAVADVYYEAIRGGVRLESIDFSGINAYGGPGGRSGIGSSAGAGAMGHGSSASGGSTGSQGGNSGGTGRGPGGPGGK